MDSKFHVSIEAARLLKEKGYNEETICYYNCAGKLYLGNGNFNYNAYAINLSAPTKSEAIDWLDGKEVYIQIGGIGSGETQKWSYSVFDYKTCDDYASGYIFPTRLEAEEAAIIKALELL